MIMERTSSSDKKKRNKKTSLFRFNFKGMEFFLIIFIFILIIIGGIFANPFSSQNNSGDLFLKHSAFGEVKVDSSLNLVIKNRIQCSYNELKDEKTERTIVNYSLEPLQNRKIDVLNIGLGCGGTLSEIKKQTDNQVDVVELNPAVIFATKKFSEVLKDVNLIQDEGLNYLRKSEKKYDSIIIDIENPAVVHSSNLYTTESFKIIKDSLKEEGTFGLWNYPCDREYYDIIYNTLKQHFNYVYNKEEFLFISSNVELPYEEYSKYTEIEEINSMNKKVLSTLFLNKCWTWEHE